MIVTCSECTTSFQLDEARIPATGAQVRCSRCKHAFFLPHPSASQSEAVHGIAEAAAADPASTAPPASSDLSGMASSGLGESNATDDFEEEEWQFSEEVRVEGDDEVVEESAADAPESEFGLGADFGDGLDADALSADVGSDAGDLALETEGPSVAAEAATDDGSGSGLELDGPAEAEAVADIRDESSFGSVDDFSSLMEDDEGTSSAPEVESSASIETVAAESAGSYASGGVTDDLGDPESWDLVGGAPASAPVATRGSAPRKVASRQATAGQALEGALAELSFSKEEGELGYEDDREPSALFGALGKVGNVAGWLVTIAAVVGVAALLVGPEFARWADAPQTAQFGGLRAETSEMHWVETARAGFLLVVRGEATNTGETPLEPSNLRLWLLDGTGERLSAAPLQIAIPLAEETLREAGISDLQRQLDASAAAFAGRPMAPGETRAFEAVVLEEVLPTRARRVLLEFADPSAEAPIHTRSARVDDPAQAVAGTDSSATRISDQLDLAD